VPLRELHRAFEKVDISDGATALSTRCAVSG